MEKIEQLLNSLIEKGWCPIGRKYTGPHKPYFRSYIDGLCGRQFFYNEWWDGEYEPQRAFTLRELTSINSGLWQFVCENKLYKDYNEDRGTYWDSMTKCYNYRDYEYRVIESSLKDENELKEFILDSIKVKGNE